VCCPIGHRIALPLAHDFSPGDDNFGVIPRYEAFLGEKLRDLGWELVGHSRREDLASAHLQAAVRQGQESAIKEAEFHRYRKELEEEEEPGRKVFSHISAMGALDRSVEASRAAVIIAVAALEAFINDAARGLPSWSDEEDKVSIEKKWIVVPERLAGGRTFDKGQQPYQDFHKLVALRNRLVHPSPREDFFSGEFSLVAAMLPSSKLDVGTNDGRKACATARRMILEFCRLVRLSRPSWCAYVPPTKETDLESWSTANILTGIRDDPDFPKVGNRA